MNATHDSLASLNMGSPAWIPTALFEHPREIVAALTVSTGVRWILDRREDGIYAQPVDGTCLRLMYAHSAWWIAAVGRYGVPNVEATQALYDNAQRVATGTAKSYLDNIAH